MANLSTRWRWFCNELKKTDSRMWFITLFLSLLLLAISFILLVVAGSYLNEHFRGNDGLQKIKPLHDFVLDFLPIVDLTFLVKVGLFTSVVLFLIGGINEPSRLTFFILIVSFWVLVRTAFMIATPMAPPEGILSELPKDFTVRSIWDYIWAGLASPHTLFFSGHTGLAFLGHLLFKREIRWKTLIWPLALITFCYFISSALHFFWATAALAIIWLLVLINKDNFFSLSSLFLIWSFVMAASVLLTRNHYSVDVLGAYFITAGIVLIGKWCFKKVELLCDKIEVEFFNKEK